MQNINQLYKLFPPALSEDISTLAVERMSGRALRRPELGSISLFCLLEILASSLTMLIFNYIVTEIQMFVEFPDDKYNAWSRLAFKNSGCLNHLLSRMVLHPFPGDAPLRRTWPSEQNRKRKWLSPRRLTWFYDKGYRSAWCKVALTGSDIGPIILNLYFAYYLLHQKVIDDTSWNSSSFPTIFEKKTTKVPSRNFQL